MLLFNTLQAKATAQELMQFDELSLFLSKLDIELTSHQAVSNDRLETIDASLAANIVHANLKNLEAEIKDLEENRAAEVSPQRKEWCI